MQQEPQPTEAVEIFYPYSHNPDDERLKDELPKQLAGVERQGVIVSWHDRKVIGGQEWAGEIDAHINTAGVILLLISPDFMASGYCNSRLPHAARRLPRAHHHPLSCEPR